MAAKNDGVALSAAVAAAPNLQPARRNQDAGAVQNEEATAQAEHVAEIAVEFAGNRDVPYSQPSVLATNASKARLLGEAYLQLLDILNHAGYAEANVNRILTKYWRGECDSIQQAMHEVLIKGRRAGTIAKLHKEFDKVTNHGPAQKKGAK